MSTPLKPTTNSLPTVLLFGRANVGKSTLFNKLIGRSQALVADRPGTTRDPNRAVAEWQGARFNLIDAGGIIDESILARPAKRMSATSDDIDVQVQAMARQAITQADVIVFVGDSKTGPLQQDTVMARLVKRLVTSQPVIAVANKADTQTLRTRGGEFFSLGLGEPLAVSAASGSGTGDLLDRIAAALPAHAKSQPESESEPETEPESIRVVVIGKPNVGKSSLFNALLGSKTAIVSAAAHTTREPQDATVEYNGTRITFTDTAGLVRNQSAARDDELVSGGMSKTVTALKRADIALLLLDITQGASHFEAQLASDILESGVNAIIVGNKWDLAEVKDTKAYRGLIYRNLPFLTWAPVVFLSAKNKTKIKPLLQTIHDSHSARTAQLSEEQLDEFLRSAVRHASPLANRKQRGIMKHKLPRPHLQRLEQTSTNPPHFHLHAKAKLGIKETYITYLKNRLRDTFHLVGTPIEITVTEQR